MRICIAVALLATGAAEPALALGWKRFARQIEAEQERRESAKDDEMRSLIGPNYEAAPETDISENSREAAGNIDPSSLRSTTYNGLLAELDGTDRDPGTVQTAAVGEVAYAQFSYFVRPAYHLMEPLNWSPAPDEQYAVPKQTSIKPSAYDEAICSSELLGSLKGKPKKRVCFRDADNDRRFDSVSGIVRFEDRRPLERPLPYRIAAKSIVASKFRRELVYLGRAGDTLRFQYREFQTNLIRPAFTSEMTYTLEPKGPTQIRYQSVRLEIQSVSNDGIRYVIGDK